MFSPDRFQLEALDAIKHADCLVTAPTGSGKTWIAEQAIARIRKRDGRAWYACPLKALSNAKYADFGRIFGPDQVGILTGDRKENPDAPITVGTTEILRNQLYDAMHRGESLDSDFVIIDEAHFLGDAERGVVEEVMIYLPARIPLLLLSATIGNARRIADWLSTIRGRPCVVVEEKRRPVPLFPLFLHPTGLLLPLTAQTRKGNEIRLQGLVLAGKILAEAAAIYDERNATQSQSYGPEARGGASKSEVIIADGEIDYPKAERLDLQLVLTQEALDKYWKDLRPGGWLVVDEDAVTRLPEGDFRVVRVPFVRLARERLARPVVANIIALGLIVRLTRVVSEEAAEQAILARVPRGTEELNRRAYHLGLEVANEVSTRPVAV